MKENTIVLEFVHYKEDGRIKRGNSNVEKMVEGIKYCSSCKHMLDCGWTDSATLEVVEAPELEALLSMTPRDYLEGVQPGLYDTLVVGESKKFENGQDIMRSVLLESDGSLMIQQGSISVNIRPSQETGLIDYFSVTFYQ